MNGPQTVPQKSAVQAGNSAENDVSYISQFFSERSVFITGATGFVGKVLLEKLLRDCNGVRTVYILLRTKDGQDVRQRLDELLTSQAFDKVKRDQPKGLTKVVPISGDITLPGLGISQSDVAVLLKHVSVVFHSAATVRFDEPLKKSVELNVVGTQRVLHLCQKMPYLEALVHVSTAYSYCNRRAIEECVYPEKVPPQRVIEMTEWMDDDLINCLLPKLLDGRPTTYHYTKALAESLLIAESDSLPIAIVRPSIVTASVKEPMPGWVDGMNGPSTFIVATAKGLLRTMVVYKDNAVDWVPVDKAVNLLLTVAWHTATKRPNGVKVYNCTSGNLNRVTWSDIEKTAYPLIIRHPSIKVLRYPGGSFKANRFLNTLSVKLEHRLPAIVIDFLARTVGYKTEFVSMVDRMERAAGFLEYFTTTEWIFSCSNLLALMELQCPKDREVFNFDVREIEWLPYLEDYVLGVRKYILKENESTLPAARRRLKRLYYAGFIAQCLCVFGVIHLLLTRTNLSNFLMWTLIGWAFKLMQYMPKSWLRALS